jgi:hypothetical protein
VTGFAVLEFDDDGRGHSKPGASPGKMPPRKQQKTSGDWEVIFEKEKLRTVAGIKQWENDNAGAIKGSFINAQEANKFRGFLDDNLKLCAETSEENNSKLNIDIG